MSQDTTTSEGIEKSLAMLLEAVKEISIDVADNNKKILQFDKQCDYIIEEIKQLYPLCYISSQTMESHKNSAGNEIYKNEGKIFSPLIIDAFVEALKIEFKDSFNMQLKLPKIINLPKMIAVHDNSTILPITINGIQAGVAFYVPENSFTKFFKATNTSSVGLQTVGADTLFFELLTRIGLQAQNMEPSIDCLPIVIGQKHACNKIPILQLMFTTDFGQFDLTFIERGCE